MEKETENPRTSVSNVDNLLSVLWLRISGLVITVTVRFVLSIAAGSLFHSLRSFTNSLLFLFFRLVSKATRNVPLLSSY